MTTVALLCEPPRPGRVLQPLVASSPLTDEEAADLYAAMTRDVANAVAESGGELLVNYRDVGDAGGVDDEADPEAEIGSVLEPVVDPGDDRVRFEVQVGETFAGRAGNTATHLLEREGVGSVAIVRPEAAFLRRTDVDGAAMTLRRADAVLGPAPGGRVYLAALAAPIDFADAYAAPALETLTDRCLAADLEVSFAETKPYLETGADLAHAITAVRAARRAGGLAPPHLADWVEDADLSVLATDEGLTLTR